MFFNSDVFCPSDLVPLAQWDALNQVIDLSDVDFQNKSV